jgi:hypothetical protein
MASSDLAPQGDGELSEPRMVPTNIKSGADVLSVLDAEAGPAQESAVPDDQETLTQELVTKVRTWKVCRNAPRHMLIIVHLLI